MLTVVPGSPLVGENDEIVGGDDGWPTVNVAALVAVPVAFVTEIGPVVAPLGTVAVMMSSETTEYPAATPPMTTLLAAPKLVPRIVTVVPEAPEVGVNDATVGAAGATSGLETAHVGGDVASPARNAQVPRSAGVAPSQCCTNEIDPFLSVPSDA